MALSTIEPTKPPNPSEIKLYIGQNYEAALNQSIQDLLDSVHTLEDADFANFIEKFYELMQVKVDPPLETLWIYSALKFRTFNSSKNGTLDQISIHKELFQLVSACSTSCHPLKCIVLLAPLLFKLYEIVAGLWDKVLSSKKERKMMTEIRSLVDVVFGFIGVCCCPDSSREDECCRWVRPARDLICLWVDENVEVSESVRLFFPLVSDGIQSRVSREECDVSELAGVVMAEFFLLRLCLSFRSGITKSELGKELKNWAAASISGIQSSYFFEVLLEMLLEPTLPVTTLLGPQDEAILQKALYDAVILVEYSFLNPEHATQFSTEHGRTLAVTRLIIVHEAVELFRRKGDQSKAIAYTNAFSSSHLPAEIIKLVASMIGVGAKESAPIGSSPRAFIRWLLNLEDQGVRIFHDVISRFRHILSLDVSQAEDGRPEGKMDGKKAEADTFFYIDNKGEEEGNKDENTLETVNAAFLAAAQTMNETETGKARKRKDSGDSGREEIKFLKYSLPDDSDPLNGKFSHIEGDDLSSGSDTENASSDEDEE
ncbi:hypothetical protein Ancab_016956 [Ancistrocladus abbreviatus]